MGNDQWGDKELRSPVPKRTHEFRLPDSIVRSIIDSQRMINFRESAMADDVFLNMGKPKPRKPLSRWVKIKRSFMRIFEYRIVHSERIDQGEW